MEIDSRGRTRGPEEIKCPSHESQNLVYDMLSSHKVLILRRRNSSQDKEVLEKTNTNEGSVRVET